MAEIDRVLTPRSFLGTGWSFPPVFSPDVGVALSVDEQDIRESLEILFSTAAGERFLRPRFGLDMREMLFEPMSTTTKTYLEDRIKTSVLIYEPRITLLKLQLDTSFQHEGRVTLVLDYMIRATNSRYNLVFPFYEAGSEVRAGFVNV